MTTIALLGTLDTKRAECHWLADRLRESDCQVLLVDVGTFSDQPADITAAEVARAAGTTLPALREGSDRGTAMVAMGAGAAVLLARAHEQGRIDGLLAIGGSSGSSVAAAALQALPVGVPKMLVSTMASGDVRPYVGALDVCLMYSVVDIAGINRVSEEILGNAAVAVAAMGSRHHRRRRETREPGRPLIGLTMFGVTTPAADEARERLTTLGYEVLVFHATGTGGRAMEALARSGLLTGILDLTTTELADDLVGGVLSAGPDRLEAAGRIGLPQVVSVGALDMVNFGPLDTVPEAMRGRRLLQHNPAVTLMRTTEAEMAELGRRIAAKLRTATGPTRVLLPERGVSAVDVAGGVFSDPAADAACFAAVRAGLAGSAVPVDSLDLAINDPGFGRAAADALHALIPPAGAPADDRPGGS